jgi:hypothetical protein
MSTTTTTTPASTTTTSTNATHPFTNVTNSSTAGGSFFASLVLGPSQRAEELKQLQVREKDCEAKRDLFTVISSKNHKSIDVALFFLNL